MQPARIILICLLFVACAETLVVLEPAWLLASAPSLRNMTSPPLAQFMLSFDEVGPVSLMLEKKFIAAGSPSNSCVLVPPPSGVSPDLNIVRLHRRGVECVVAVAATEIPGTGAYFRDRYDDVSEVKIPVVEISYTHGAALIKALLNGSNVVVLIQDDDPNDWKNFLESTGAVIVGMLVGVPALFNVGLAVFKLQSLIRSHGLMLSVGHTLFFIEIIGNLMRVWYGIINSNFRWGLLYLFTTICSTVGWPLNIISTLLIAIKWIELTREKYHTSTFLSVHRVPFMIASLMIFLLEFVSALLRGLYYPIILLAGVSWGLLAAISIIVSVMLWVFGYRLLKQINNVIAQDPSDGETPARSMRRSTISLMCSGGGLIITTVSIILFIAVNLLGKNTVSTSVTLTSAGLIGGNLTSMVQLLAFFHPAPSETEFIETTVDAEATEATAAMAETHRHDDENAANGEFE